MPKTEQQQLTHTTDTEGWVVCVQYCIVLYRLSKMQCEAPVCTV